MKKNISINISGIIFHVEEDGYELLKTYLESISHYFSTYEDSKEITDDIEGRIAEIFLSKLSNAKQVITKEDVEAVMATMGSVEDFAAAEGGLEEEPAFQQPYRENQPPIEENKKLYRDTRRKVIGGVAAGIAQYFHTDPIWIRLLFIALFFADIFASLGTIMMVTYIVMWIVVPGSDSLVEDEKIKKLYRNPDDKVIGGVCGGIAAYFGADATVIRLLFALSVIFFGTGILIYIVLWVITPLATTLTEKMQMKGEPVTLSNIESSIKKNLNLNQDGEESTLVKILLFPFRLIAVIIENLGRALGPLLVFLGEAARIIAGLILFLLGIVLIFMLLIVGGVLLGLYTADPAHVITNLPMDVIRASFPDWGIAFAYLVLLIPSVALLLGGIAIIARRRLVNAAVAWTVLGIWFVCLAGLSVTLVPFIMDFQDEARYTTTDTYDINGTTAILTLSNYPEDDYARPLLFLRGHDSSYFELKKEFEAHGRNRKQAMENAQMIEYNVNVQDSVFSFPPTFTFKDQARFHMQGLDMVLYVPYQQPFMIDRNLAYILRNTLNRDGYDVSDMQDNVFVFTPSGLECRTCGERKNLDNQFDSTVVPDVSGNYSKTFNVQDFKAVDISGPFRVNVIKGEEYQVKLQGKEDIVEKVEAKAEDSVLEFNYDAELFQTYNGLIGVSIIMPELSEMKFSGAAQANISGFSSPDLSIDLSGSSRAFVEVASETLSATITGASSLKLFGTTQSFKLGMNGASRLDALDFETDIMRMEVNGAAQAKVTVNQQLNADIEGAGSVEYRGNPTLNVNEGGRRKVHNIE